PAAADSGGCPASLADAALTRTGRGRQATNQPACDAAQAGCGPPVQSGPLTPGATPGLGWHRNGELLTQRISSANHSLLATNRALYPRGEPGPQARFALELYRSATEEYGG